jgi:peroxiredoxin
MKAYDASLTLMPSMADRISYVVTPDRKILFVHSGMNPDQHVSETLKALTAWQSKQAK